MSLASQSTATSPEQAAIPSGGTTKTAPGSGCDEQPSAITREPKMLSRLNMDTSGVGLAFESQTLHNNEAEANRGQPSIAAYLRQNGIVMRPIMGDVCGSRRKSAKPKMKSYQK